MNIRQGQQPDRVDELNERLYERNIPNMKLEPNFDPRPTSTKYAFFPLIALHKETKEIIQTKPTFANIQIENTLRNQHFALQHGIGHDIYIPSMSSQLYNVSVPQTMKPPEIQPYPILFQTMTYTNENLPFPVGYDMFHNHTRTQLRNTIDT